MNKSILISLLVLLTCSFSFGVESPSKITPATILYIGDSHSVGSFGKTLDGLLREVIGFQVATYAICGSCPHNFITPSKTNCGYFTKSTNGKELRGTEIDTPSLPQLLSVLAPQFTIVQQGANMYGGPLEWVKQSSTELAQTITRSGGKCIWIGPPQSRKQTEPELGRLFDTIQSAVSPYCLMIDSRKYTIYPAIGGDGIHFNFNGNAGEKIAERWAIDSFKLFSTILIK